MSINPVILERLNAVKPGTDLAYLNEAKQIVQEITLLGLHRAGFFKDAAFHGGTALRILHNLPRASEDLDFSLLQPNTNYTLSPCLAAVQEELSAYGLNSEVQEKERISNPVKMGFVKETSLGAVLDLQTPIPKGQKLRVRIELDANPPSGANSEQQLVEFPIDYYLTSYDLPSLYAGKLHALIHRPFTKGRDWYDFTFFISKRVKPNLVFLENALRQTADFDAEKISIEWLKGTLSKRIEEHLDIKKAIADVRAFLPEPEQILEIWSKKYFRDKLERAFWELDLSK